MRHDNKLVTNISLKVKKELPHSKEFTVLFYFIAYTDLYLLINRSIRCLLTGVIMYTVEIYMETDENMILQVLTFQKKNIASGFLLQKRLRALSLEGPRKQLFP